MKAPASLRALVLLAATMPFWDLGHPLWEVDDARYAEVPREMAEGGDWLTPRLNGFEYLQKPPLIYWLGALSYKVFGVSEAAARLPLALWSLLGLAGTAWLGSWLFSAATGLAAAVILGTCLQYSALSHLQTPDMALSVCLLWCTAFLLRAWRRPEDARWAGPGAGAAAGLAFLAKGLVGLLFPAAWALLLAAFEPPLRRRMIRPYLAAAATAAAVIAPWLWATAARHPGFLRHFFVEHHFQRYLTGVYDRPGPWYYFIGVDAAGLLPWTPWALAALYAALRAGRKDAAALPLALWTALVFAFFSISRSKLPTYILPIFPQQCLLAAALLARRRGPFVPAALAGAALTAVLLIGARLAGPLVSAKDLALELRERLRPGDHVLTYDSYLHGLAFYTGRPVDTMVNWYGEFRPAAGDPRHRERFGDDGTIRKLPEPGRTTYVVLHRKVASHFMTLLDSERSLEMREFGRHLLAVF